jgi:chaperonin GroES
MSSGIHPLEYKVLVKPQKIEEKTEGGIVLTNETRDKEEMAEVEAELIAVGPIAFEDWEVFPKIGAKVHFAKYAGIYVKGNDGENYRLINDKDILAIREK